MQPGEPSRSQAIKLEGAVALENCLGNGSAIHVLILGTGFYGCHAAMYLKGLGISFSIADVTNGFFNGSSSKSQNRLHLGFHYPRSRATRIECIRGHELFMTKYGRGAVDVPKNYYLVDKKSLVDFATYTDVFAREGIPFIEESLSCNKVPFEFHQDKFQGAILTQEKYVDFEKIGDYFKAELSPYLIQGYDPNLLHIGEQIRYEATEFSHLLDCTYLQADIPNSPVLDIHYELCIALLYKFKWEIPELFGFTVMDGNFFSIYPYDVPNKVFTLTDVYRTPIFQTNTFPTLVHFMNSAARDPQFIGKTMEDFRANVKQYLPNFDEDFEYAGYFLSIKTKFNNNDADRSLMHIRVGKNVHRFCGGKITGIFAMEEVLNRLFNSKC